MFEWWLRRRKRKELDRLLRCLDDWPPSVVVAAIEGLAKRDEPEAIRAVLEQARNGKGANIRNAAEAAWRKIVVPERADALMKVLADGADERCIEALDEVKPGWRTTEEAQAIVDGWIPRATAAEIRGGYGTVYLLNQLDPDWRSRPAAAGMVEILLDGLSAEDYWEAEEALRAIGTDAVVDGIRKRMEAADKKSWPRYAGVLRRMGWKPEKREERLRFARELYDEDLLVEELGDAARGELASWAKHDIAAFRNNGIEGLKKLKAVDHLLDVMKSAERDTSERAICALGELGDRRAFDEVKAMRGRLGKTVDSALQRLDPSYAPPRAPKKPKGKATCEGECGRSFKLVQGKHVEGTFVGLIQGMALPFWCPKCGGTVCTDCLAKEQGASIGDGVTSLSLACDCGGKRQMLVTTEYAKLLKELDEPDPEADHRAALLAARQFADQGRFNEAVHQLTDAIRIKPDDYESYYWRGMIRKQMGDRHGMVTDFRKALDRAPVSWPRCDEVTRYIDPTGRGRRS